MSLSPVDYCVLLGSLVLFAAAGVYFAITARVNTARHVLLGDRRLGVAPTALSIMASFLSAVSVLGFPAEVYTFGAMIAVYGVMYALAFPTAALLILPVLYDLRLTTAYEYLSLRYSLPVRRCASCAFVVQTLLYAAVVLYAPALALSSVTSLPLALSLLGTGALAAFYTTLGGATAVVYTSAAQMLVILAALLAVLVTGLAEAGGVANVAAAVQRGRRHTLLDMRPDPTVRHSVWSLLVGGTFMIWSLFTANQVTVQRYLAMPTMRQAKMTLLLNMPFNFIALSLYTLIGFVLYAAYEHCDPKTTGAITQGDQLLPYYVMERMPVGVPGLFIAAIYSAGLSTLAGSLNALSAVIYKDFICAADAADSDDKTASDTAAKRGVFLTRIIAALCGAIVIVLALGLSMLQSTILQLAMSIFGLFGGPVLGLFLCGVFLPCVNATGALIGLVVSLCGNVSLGFGAVLWAHVRPVPLPIHDTALYCTGLSNATSTALHNVTSAGAQALRVDEHLFNRLTSDADRSFPYLSSVFKVSYQYYSLTGALMCIIVAVLCSRVADWLRPAAGGQRRKVPDVLLSPLLRSAHSDVQMDTGDCAHNGAITVDAKGGRNERRYESPIHTPALLLADSDDAHD